MIGSKYQVDVSQLLALCSRNYLCILRWLPQNDELGESFQITGESGTLDVNILEKTRYTQLISISRKADKHELVPRATVTVRVYHDAKLAEVLSSQQIYRLRPVYDYPNMDMHHPDEKYQVNAFLAELLSINWQAHLVY